MKRNLFSTIFVMAFLMAIGISAIAEEITLDPSKLVPADSGYYIAGVWKDTDNDGIPDTFYNGCVDEYGDGDHREAGTQQGFTYRGAMIMPTCVAKGDQPIVSTGYIQLRRSWYLGTDSAVIGELVCPPVTNLQSLYMEVSPDVTPLATRHIYYIIEYSKDMGVTWEETFIRDESTSKNGDLKTYDGSVSLEFQEMIDASQSTPILIRIYTDPQDPSAGGQTYPQRLKIHKIILTADKASGVKDIAADQSNILIRNNTVFAKTGSISVYNMMGSLVATGESVSLNSGMYIIKSDSGYTEKVVIK
jgi:hypothetical protein